MDDIPDEIQRDWKVKCPWTSSVKQASPDLTEEMMNKAFTNFAQFAQKAALMPLALTPLEAAEKYFGLGPAKGASGEQQWLFPPTQQ